MSDLHTDGPSPAELVDLVVQLVRSDWPTSNEERIAWCTRYGLPTNGKPWGPVRDYLGQFFDAPDQPGFQFGWHSFREEFVGVNWFCWGGLTRQRVRDRAEALWRGFVEEFGPAVNEMGIAEPHLNGFTSLWMVAGRTVDMYFHSGIHELRGGELSDLPASVQLHLDHTQRSEALEATPEQADPFPEPPPNI